MLRLLIALILLCAASQPARAQTVASFEDLPLRLNVGDTVTVDTRQGQAWHGRVLAMMPDRIVLGAGGRDVTLTAAEVGTVSTCCDGVLNGALIGLGLGGIISGLIVAKDDTGAGAGAATFVAVCGAIGTAAGFGFDAMHDRQVPIYRAPRAGVRILADPAGRRVMLAMSW